MLYPSVYALCVVLCVFMYAGRKHQYWVQLVEYKVGCRRPNGRRICTQPAEDGYKNTN